MVSPLLDWCWPIRYLPSTLSHEWIRFQRLAGFLLGDHFRLKTPGAQRSPGKLCPPWNSAFKTLCSLSTAVNQTQVWSHHPLSVPPWFLSPWIVSNVSRGPRFSDSPQFYSSYQIGRRVFCELVFLEIIISPMNVENLHAEKLKGRCRRFLVALCASRRQLHSKCYVVSAKDSGVRWPAQKFIIWEPSFISVCFQSLGSDQSSNMK